MSHFTVLVVTDNGTDEQITCALQPFHEYECTGVKDEYVVAVEAEESREELLKDFDELYKDDYESFDQFLKGYYGYEELNGKVIRWTNPNYKWDWWMVGGRWRGMLMINGETREALSHKRALQNKRKPIPDSLIEKTKGVRLGDPSWTNLNENVPVDVVDSARKHQIDFDGMMRLEKDRARKDYKTFHEILGDGTFLTWEECLAKQPDDVKAAREEYNGQSVIKEFNEVFGPFLDLSSFLKPEEDYVNEKAESAFSTFAVLYNGEWVEKGRMGWWACVTNENKEWAKDYQSILDSIPDDKYLTVVDCHI